MRKEQGNQGSLQGRDDIDRLWDSSCVKRRGELRGVEGQQRRGRIRELQVAVEFKDCLSPDILITPIIRMKSFCLEGWNYLTCEELAREWPSWLQTQAVWLLWWWERFSHPDFWSQRKERKKKSNQCWWPPRAPNTRSGTVSGRGPWDPGSSTLSPEWYHVMSFWKDLCFRKLCSMSCASLDGRRLWGRMDTCIHRVGSLCYPPETITALLNGYTSI